VPPLVYQNVPQNQAYPLNGDGRYWWQTKASTIGTGTTALLHFPLSGAPAFQDLTGNVWSTAYGHPLLSPLTPFVLPAGSLGSLICTPNAAISTPIVQSGPLDFNTPNSDFTVECFIYSSSNASGTIAWMYGNSSLATESCIYLEQASSELLLKAQSSLTTWTNTISSSTTISINTWYHTAVVRHGTNASLYLNGAFLASGVWAGPLTEPLGPLLYVGGPDYGSTGWAGQIAEFRVSDYAVYTSSFTPPVQPFGLSGGTASIVFIGNPSYMTTGSAALQWSITQYANDGSVPYLQYSQNGYLFDQIPLGQGAAPQNGVINVPLTTAATELEVWVYSVGGTVSTAAIPTQVALAITRNAHESIPYDSPDPFDPVGYNGLVIDNNVPTATMASLSNRLLVRLGFASQAANPPPGMAALVQDFLTSAQTFLYRRYLQLHTKRLFRWKVNPGQRYYSLLDNDENVLEGVNMDYAKTIEWAGIQDSRNVWYPLIQGIPPQLYTMITKPWRPARYEIRGSIELYPAPDQTYWLWMKGHFGLMPFTLSTQSTTIDSELVFLHALANAKSHYGQPDANNIEAQANAYRAELIAATHQTAHYLPGTIAVPPAVRPTLIQFDGSGGGA